MAFMNEDQLRDMGFKKLGLNIKISDKASFYNCDQIEIGDNSRIDDFCVVSGKVKIGRNVHVAIFCNLAGGEEGIELHDFAGLAYGCQIFAQSDDYSGTTMTNPTVPKIYKNEIKKAIVIDRHVIVGTNSLVFPGVHLQEGSAIGAMTLVRKSTEPWSIYSGNPAKKIKSRNKNLLNLESDYLSTEKK
jgi:acetyltransferase-like isoleucine patch superfamily enzyme